MQIRHVIVAAACKSFLCMPDDADVIVILTVIVFILIIIIVNLDVSQNSFT